MEAPSRWYDVVVGSGTATSGALGERVRAAAPRAQRALVIADAGLPDTSIDGLAGALAAAGMAVVHDASQRLKPDEAMKVMGTVSRLTEMLTAAKLDRGDVVIAMGGGVVGDLAGFAAAMYRRGVAWVNVPTSLLAMVDASVGGKTGANVLVNGSLKKNMVGAFWQPSLVVADIALLRSLPARQMRSGLAECLKHGMLAADWGDAGLGEWTQRHLADIAAGNAAVLTELVARNVAVKARVIGSDEREEAADAAGGRALLNLGHTFGHAIETLPGLKTNLADACSPLLHGEAVAIGLVAASAAAEAMGLASPGLTARARATVDAAGLPTRVRGLPRDEELLRLMGDDKKVARGQLRLVLPKGEGRCVVVSGPEPEVVCRGWAEVRG